MTQSSGQMDATIWSKCSESLETPQRHAGTDCHADRMTGRNTSNATHTVLSRRLHPCAAAPPSLQNSVASTNPAMAAPTIGLKFREYVYCPVMSASCATLCLGST